MTKKNLQWLLFPVLIVIGCFFGRPVGSILITSVVLKDYALPLLFTRPVNQFYDMHILINSANPYSRLSGYYALIDNKMINNQFLIDRYGKERNFALKRTILWVLSFSDNKNAVLKFYSSIYKNNDEMAEEILALMKRINEEYYYKFIQNNRIDEKKIGHKRFDFGDIDNK